MSKNLSGLYVYSLSDSTQLRLVKDSVATAHQLNYLPNPTVSITGNVVYSIGDEMFIKDMETSRSKLIYTGQTNSNPHPMAFVGIQPVVLFSETFRDTHAQGFGKFRISMINVESLRVLPVPVKLDSK